MAGLTFKFLDKGVAAKLNKLKALTGNMTPAYAAIGRSITTKIRLGFKLGVDPWGNPWLALKMRKGQPLRDTGRLQSSILARPDATGVTIGTNVKYARTHQFGATIVPVKAKMLAWKDRGGSWHRAKKVVVPPRPFMPIKQGGQVMELPPDWREAAARAVKAYFKRAVDKEGA